MELSDEKKTQLLSELLDLQQQIVELNNQQERVQKAAIVSEAVLDTMPGCVILSNEKGQIMLVNARAQALLGYSQRELIGQPIELLLPVSNRDVHKHLRESYNQSPSDRPMGVGRDLIARHKDGTEIPVEIGLSSLETPYGKAVLSFMTDITVRKQNERTLLNRNEQLEQRVVERTQELELANGRLKKLEQIRVNQLEDLWQELRHPIAGLLVYLELLDQKHTQKSSEYLEGVQIYAQQLVELSKSIDKFGQIKALMSNMDLALININWLAQEAVAVLHKLAEEKGLVMTFVPETDPLIVSGNDKQLFEAVTILLKNAINYTQVGAITVSTFSRTEENLVGICIKDTGIGIVAEDMPHIFDHFYRGKNVPQKAIPGMGFGLGLVKDILTLHNGGMTVDSLAGQGSTFTLNLPMAPKNSIGNYRVVDNRE